MEYLVHRIHRHQTEGFSILLRLITTACLLLIANLAMAQATDDEPRLPKPFMTKMTALIKHYYPEMTVTTNDHEVSFVYRTRTFMIHHPTKTGQWQEARPEQGPHPDGILCRLRVQTGPYNGAAVLPQTFDYRYFKVLIMAPYSKKTNCHLHAQLYYPEQKTSPDFLRHWSQLVDDFE